MTDVTLPREFAVARSEPRGLAAWLMGTDHKHVGLQYMVTALVFFCIGASIASSVWWRPCCSAMWMSPTSSATAAVPSVARLRPR